MVAKFSMLLICSGAQLQKTAHMEKFGLADVQVQKLPEDVIIDLTITQKSVHQLEHYNL